MGSFNYLSIKEVKELCNYIRNKNKEKDKEQPMLSYYCKGCPFYNEEAFICASLDEPSDEELKEYTTKARKILDEKNRLIQCPFCGRDDTLTVASVADFKGEDSNDYDFDWDRNHYTTGCDFTKGGCGASIGYYYESIEEAEEAWNKRKI